MPFIKGKDGKPKTVLNPLEDSIGNIDLDNISANTFTSSGNAAVGNILTNGYYYANGSAISFGSDYGNSNVASYLPVYGGNVSLGNAAVSGNVSVTGNVAVGNILTNGYYYANGVAVSFGTNYANSNVASYLTVYGGNILAGNVSVTGNVVGNVTFSPLIPTDWGNVANSIINVYTALNYLANAKADLSSQVTALTEGAGFDIPGPYVNQAAAITAGVGVGEIYFDNGGTVRVVLP